MKNPRSSIRLLDSDKGTLRRFNTGISLHCHTQQSKEILDFVPHYASKIPVVSGFFRQALEKHERKNGQAIDFGKAYWTPPIVPRAVMDAECEQIERILGLDSIVSVTDHDDIRACTNLQVLRPDKEIPVSCEWTLPFSPGFFHIGVHNLPREKAGEIWAMLKSYTAGSWEGELTDLLEKITEDRGTLLVLNHPLWDIERIGETRHRQLLGQFLTSYGRWIHAVEVNGYRSWAENEEAISLAGQFGYPLISGGDRHGQEPNALLNLTTARSFSEFIAEIRFDRTSEVAVLPAYKEPLVMRTLEAVGDVLRYYPTYPKGQRFWTDRIFWTLPDGTVRPMSFYWGSHGPGWVRASMRVMRIIGSRRIRPAMRLVLPGQQGVVP
jgi:hypothetical protein